MVSSLRSGRIEPLYPQILPLDTALRAYSAHARAYEYCAGVRIGR